MIVPDYWAEARRQQKKSGKQITVRRFGWSTSSQEDAQAMADARADEAMRRINAGEKLDWREQKVPHNGADGLPIREEVLARHGDEVITRNSYGAHCLNSPKALFADIDLATETGCKPTLITLAILAVLSVTTGGVLESKGTTFVLLLISLFAAAHMPGGVTFVLACGPYSGTEGSPLRHFIFPWRVVQTDLF